MEVLLPKASLQFSVVLLPPPAPPSSFGIPSRRGSCTLRLLSRRRRGRNREIAAFCSVVSPSPSVPSTYGGWDDPGLEEDAGAGAPGAVLAFRGLFVAMGIADGKFAVLFCLGFLSALAVSRVRVWTLAVLPFSGLVFVFGVLVGASRGGVARELLARIRRQRGPAELSREETRVFGEMVDDFGVKLSELRSGLQRFVDLNGAESDEMKRFVGILDSLTLIAVHLKKIIQDSTPVDCRSEPLGEDYELETKSNTKSSKRKREVGGVGSDIIHFLVATFQDVLIGRDSQRTRDSGVRREAVEKVSSADPSYQIGVRAVDGSVLANKDKQVFPMSMPSSKRNDVKVDELPKEPLEARLESSEISSGTMRRNSTETEKSHRSVADNRNPLWSAESAEDKNSASRFRYDSHEQDVLSDREDLNVSNRDFRFMSMQGSYHKVVLQHRTQKTEIGRQKTRMEDHAESGLNEMVSFSSVAEMKSRMTPGVYDKPFSHAPNDRLKGNVKDERASQTIYFRDKSIKLETQTELDDQNSELDPKVNKRPLSSSSAPTSAPATNDADFDHVVNHGVDLLRQAGECLKGQNDEKAAEVLLYKSTRLLSTAVSMKPGNLLALGQLGNTCLLHGELKLKMSRDLRTLLLRRNPVLIGRRHRFQSGEQHNQLNKDVVASVLSDVCEECEELLIEAGRNYKMVLSYDKCDARALYNWGLALSFRAQLIADIGPDAAVDADKVYLAAIEKFDAMLSRSNDYAPDALFRWGMALWERSHLRPSKSREKMKLLQQAKALFEDVLLVDSDNPHVQEALNSCTSELSFGRRLD